MSRLKRYAGSNLLKMCDEVLLGNAKLETRMGTEQIAQKKVMANNFCIIAKKIAHVFKSPGVHLDLKLSVLVVIFKF